VKNIICLFSLVTSSLCFQSVNTLQSNVMTEMLADIISLRFNGHFPDEPGLAGIY